MQLPTPNDPALHQTTDMSWNSWISNRPVIEVLLFYKSMLSENPLHPTLKVNVAITDYSLPDDTSHLIAIFRSQSYSLRTYHLQI
jgi:hypothetical protein